MRHNQLETLAIGNRKRHIRSMNNSSNLRIAHGAIAMAFLAFSSACTPEVQIRAPEKPIVINLNVKIEQEIRVKVEKDIDDLLLKNKDLF